MTTPGHEAAVSKYPSVTAAAPGSTPGPGTMTLVDLHAWVGRHERSIARVELSNAIGLLLKRSDYRTVAEVRAVTDDQLAKTRGLSRRMAGRLRAYLEREGLC